MDQDHKAEAKRRDELARTRNAAKPDGAGKTAHKQIDPERLGKAIRYLKEHPNQQVGLQSRISDFLRRTQCAVSLIKSKFRGVPERTRWPASMQSSALSFNSRLHADAV